MSDEALNQIVTPPAPEPAPTPVEKDDIGAAWDRVMRDNGSDRDPTGRFASPNPEQPSPGGEEGAGEPAVTPPAAATPAPAHLPQAIKADWEKIPETARNAIAAHQADMDRKFGEVGKQLQAVKPIADRLTEATSKFPEFAGMTPERLAQGALELAAVQTRLNKGPQAAVETIMEIAKAYHVLPMLAQAFSANPPSDQNQLITGLQQKIANLESQLQKAGNPETIRETVSTTLRERETETVVQDFAKGKEFWTEVEASIPDYIRIVMGEPGQQRTPSEVLETAYDMAINANPAVRAKVRAAEAKATAQVPDPKRAADARKAASINVKSATTGKDRPMTFEEAAGVAYDRAMAN